jgi:moderate conductance mechanosensitive channel
LTAVFVALAGVAPALAQTFPLPLSTLAPANGFDVRQEGIYVTAPISLDGAVLFRIAERSGPISATPALTYRVTLIENALQEVLASIPAEHGTRTAFEPQSFRVRVALLRDQAVLSAIDDHHRYGLPLLTITSADARHNDEPVSYLAEQWRGVLQVALLQALLKRQPAIFNDSLARVVRSGAALLIVTILAFAAIAFLRREMGRLATTLSSRESDMQQEQARAVDSPPDPAKPHHSMLLAALERVGPQNQLKFLGAVAGLLFWGLLLAWTIAIPWALFLFPQTTPLAYSLSRGATQVATIWIGAAILNRLLDVAIARTAAAWHARYDAPTEERARQLLRVPTVAHAVAGFKTFLVVFFAALATLGAVGIPVASVVTIGGLAALGISLAAQNIIRDFVNGFLVLFEDQYVVGDYVTINTCRGLVEQLSLRMVQIREAGGSLTTIGHSSVASVANESRNWSRVLYRISLDPATDVPRALDVIQGAIDSLATDPKWADAIVPPLESLGIEDQTRDWVLIRATLKTAPLRQFTLRREIHLRVRAALEEAKISLGAAPGGTELS